VCVRERERERKKINDNEKIVTKNQTMKSAPSRLTHLLVCQ
jgi:hypothetical protein